MWINHYQRLPQGTSARECGEHEVQIASTAILKSFCIKGSREMRLEMNGGVKRRLCKDGKN